MLKTYQDSIAQAKKILRQTPDKAHDFAHTKRVIKNATELAKKVNYKDLDFIELCCWWHDVGRTIEDHNHQIHSAAMLRQDLQSRNIDEEIIRRAYLAVSTHRWHAKPITVEGHILKDADKLDTIELDRWLACLAVGQHKHLKDIKNLLPEFRAMFHFDQSREIFDAKFDAFSKSGLASKV